MSDADDYRKLMQDAVRELRRSRERIAELERTDRARRSPAQIVGMACRLPAGVDSVEQLWPFLQDGGDAIAPAPADRWQQPAVAERTPPGAFLADPFGFDARFFRMAPREARIVDPQQRMLLELAYATVEHAGIAPDTLRRSDTGVFVGISTNDWSMHLTTNLPLDEVDGASGPGTNQCAAAGRISFALGLEGPSFAVNTACSSSLVALHLAMQALRNGECELCLVLGINLMLSPLTTLTFDRAGMLAPDGRCKTFGAAADGYARGEGAVGLLLATDDAATRRHLRRHAQVLGTAINQDGATSGLTVPSGTAQRGVIRRALADAGVQPADVQFVEAHGTGTLLGDPIEINALADVYGAGRAADDKLRIASTKTNFGHLEAAAGLLGVVRTALQLEHRRLAPHRSDDAPNPHIDWAALPVEVVETACPWPERPQLLGAISSFGFTGTNAHAILAAAPPTPLERPAATATSELLALSANDDRALRTLCSRWADAIAAHPEWQLRDVAATAAHGRAPLAVRLAIEASTPAEAIERLRAAAHGQPPAAADTLATIAAAWNDGDPGPLRRHYDDRFERLPLPTYPFQHRSYRVPFLGPEKLASAPTTRPVDDTERVAAVQAASPDRRAALLRDHVQHTCAEILRMPADELEPDVALLDYGFDSMRAVELATRLEQQLQQPMPFSDLVDGATVADVADAIDRRWSQPAAAGAADDAALLTRIRGLSDEEARRRLHGAGGNG